MTDDIVKDAIKDAVVHFYKDVGLSHHEIQSRLSIDRKTLRTLLSELRLEGRILVKRRKKMYSRTVFTLQEVQLAVESYAAESGWSYYHALRWLANKQSVEIGAELLGLQCVYIDGSLGDVHPYTVDYLAELMRDVGIHHGPLV